MANDLIVALGSSIADQNDWIRTTAKLIDGMPLGSAKRSGRKANGEELPVCPSCVGCQIAELNDSFVLRIHCATFLLRRFQSR